MEHKIPAHLSTDTAKWVKNLLEEYDFSDSNYRLLLLAAEALDRCNEARDALKAEGCYYMDRFNAPRLHPAAKVEDQAKNTYARIIKQLNIEQDSEEKHE
jgi:hypothetical protein